MKIETQELVVLLGQWDRGSGPLYLKLSDSFRKLLEIGRFESGAQLPPERKLAKALAVSRNTVASAYNELRKEGWVRSRQGSATVVALARHSPAASHRESGLFASLVVSPDISDRSELLDLTVAVPGIAPVLKDIISSPGKFVDVEKQLSGHGIHTQGLPDLRVAVAAKLSSDGFSTKPEEILITNGAQQGLSLVIRAFVRPGDAVAIDEVTFPGALDAIRVSRGVLTPVKFGLWGTDVEDLVGVIAERQPRLLYVIPTFHNPSGVLMPHRQRSELAKVVTDSEITVIDDLTLSDLDHSAPAPAPLAMVAPDASVISVGSLSKVFWGGLRIGWIRAKESVVTHLASHKVSHDLATSAPAQMIALAAINHHEEVRAWRNKLLAASTEALGNEVAQHLPDWTWTPPAGGPYAWLRLPETNTTDFAQLALRKGIAVVPGVMLAARDGVASDCIRLPLYPSPEELSRAAGMLEGVWRDYRSLNSCN